LKFLRIAKSIGEYVLAGIMILGVVTFFGYCAWAVTFGSSPNVYCQGERSEMVVVPENGNIWNIASKHFPDADTTIVVDRITQMNNLKGASVHQGQRLYIPETCG